MPMLAIVGQAARTAIGGHYQQELDLHTTFKDVASAFVETAMAPAQVRHLVDRAMRIALGERRVTALILPKDVQELEYESPPNKHNTIHSGIGYTRPKMVPYEADLQRAAEVLNAGKKVAMLVGAGAFGATDEVIAVADRLGAGCATALLGKMVLPSDLPWNTECIGLIGTKPSINLMDECDTLFMIGSGFPWAEFLPKQGKARGVQIDTKPAMLSIRFPMEVNLNGDSKDTLKALLPMLRRSPTRPGAGASRSGKRPGRRPSRTGRSRRPTRSTRNARSMRPPSACRTTPSSPPIPARPQTGMRATSR